MDESEFKSLTPHPFANLLPWIRNEEQFGELVEDIAKNGLISPIVLFQGQILDGRNRHKAVLALGEAFAFSAEHHIKRFNGSDEEALDYVESLNVHRRHLTPAQRAMAALAMADLRGAGETQSRTAIDRDIVAASNGELSEFLVKKARAVREGCEPHIVAFVEQGLVTANAAANVATLSRAKQRSLKTPAAIEKAAKRTNEVVKLHIRNAVRAVRDIADGHIDLDLAITSAANKRSDGIEVAQIDMAIGWLQQLRARLVAAPAELETAS